MFVPTTTFGSFNDYVPPAPPVKVKPGELYPGLICGVFPAKQDAYQQAADAKETEGIAYLICFRDEDDHIVFKATKVLTIGRWSYGAAASYGKFVRDMLGSTNSDEALSKECNEKGVGDPALWVGHPCVVQFTGKTSNKSQKTYFALDRVGAPNKYVQGFEEVPADAPVCALKDAFPNFIHPSLSKYIVMPGVTLATSEQQGVNLQAVEDNEVKTDAKDDISDIIF